MRKRYWVLLAIMVFGGAGNLIGGTDTPGRAAVDPAVSPAAVRADIPAAPRFEATMFVSANSLNLREAPSTGGRVITSLSLNTQVLAGERRSGWVLVSAQGQVGWVSEQYLVGAPVAPSISVPSRSQPGFQVVQKPNAASCTSRQLHPDRLTRGSAVVLGQLQQVGSAGPAMSWGAGDASELTMCN